jgi:putative transposase
VGRNRRTTMKTSKFSEAQIAYILRQAEDGTAIGEVCRSAGISEATFYIYGLFSLCKAESGGA